MPKSLTKNAICESVSATNGCTQKQAVDVVETLIELIKLSLEAGNDVLISEFGKFSVRQKNERRGRNPATDESMMLKPRRVVTFKCSGKTS